MTDLAACYFCGGALDASLASVTLGNGPDPPTVRLCPGCREKLETVLEALDRGGAVDEATSRPASTADADAEPATGAAPPSETPASADPPESSDEPEQSHDSTPATTRDDTAEDDETPSDEAVGAGDEDDPLAAATDADGAAGDGNARSDASDESAEESTDHESTDRTIAAGEEDLSALEYNKVMRLLQNREFPVDREAFVTVAANAYQVSPADCDRVLDVAIDRGLLDEEDGALVSGD